MASAILTSVKRGAYLAIGLYVAIVLVVSVTAQSQHGRQAPIEVAYPGIQFEHRTQNALVDHEAIVEAVGA